MSKEKLYLSISTIRYQNIRTVVQGEVSEIALWLASWARTKAKGRMSDDDVKLYAEEWEKELREDAEKTETKELILKANSLPFKIGTNKDDSIQITMPTIILEVDTEPIEFNSEDI